MSRERKRRRDARYHFSGRDIFFYLVRQIALQEQRLLKNIDDWDAYIKELLKRGIIVDQGPLPSGERSLSFHLDQLGPGTSGHALPLDQILGADRPIRRGA